MGQAPPERSGIPVEGEGKRQAVAAAARAASEVSKGEQKGLDRRGVNTRVTGARGGSTQAEDEHAARALVGLSMDGSGGD